MRYDTVRFRLLLLLAVAILAGSTGWAQSEGVSPSVALTKRVNVDIRDEPLQAVIEFIGQQSGLRLEFDHQELSNVGVDIQEPVTLTVLGVSADYALGRLAADHYMSCVVENGRIVITSQEVGESTMRAQVFDVPADLRKDAHQQVPTSELDWLIEMIETVVAPETWMNVGGMAVSKPFRGRLLVVQRPEHLKSIAKLLKEVGRMVARSSDEASERPSNVQLLPAAPRFAEALDQPWTEDIQATSLSELARELSQRCKIPVVVNHNELEIHDLSVEQPAHLVAAGRPWRLDLARQLARYHLNWSLDEEALVLTSTDDSANMTVQAYFASDLLGNWLAPNWLADERRDFELSDLRDLIQATVAPQSWDDVGGPGSIELVPEYDVLVVSQLASTHVAIEEFLRQLRATTGPASTARPDDLPERPKRVVVYTFDTPDDGAPLVPVVGQAGGSDAASSVLSHAIDDHLLPWVLARQLPKRTRSAGQDDPFGAGDPPRRNADPSRRSRTPQDDDPFHADDDPRPEEDDPFGQSRDDNPFGADDDPFGADDDPFGKGDDPFGKSDNTFNDGDPFGADDRPRQAPDGDPFGAGEMPAEPAQPDANAGGGFGGGPLNYWGYEQYPITEQQLMDLVKQLIEPASWHREPGTVLAVAQRRLIVRHTDEVHRQIRDLARRLKISGFREIKEHAELYGIGSGGMF